MSSVRKAFDKSLYNAYDSPARDALITYLESDWHTILSSEEDFNVDVISQKGDTIYFSEVEVKTAWKGEWPSSWHEIRIPERKQRLLDKHLIQNGVLNFYIFRPDFKQAWRIKDTLLTQESLKVVSNRFIANNEKFFHISYKDAELINL